MRSDPRFILSVIVLVGAICGFAGAASAAGLFDAATSTDMRAARASKSTDGALRQRLVRLNISELARIVPAGADHAADRLQRAQDLDAPVTIDLFPGLSVTASRTDIDAPEDGGYVWSGKSAGAPDSFVTLVINNGEVLGHVQTAGKVFSIEPVSGALHRVIEIDQSKILDDLHPPPPPPGLLKNSETAAPAATTRAKTTINVMIAHTVNARKEVGTAAQMQARINLAVALANTAFTNSGVQIKFTRVGGTNEITYADATLYGGATSNNYTGVLCDVTGMANCFSTGNNKTATFKALRTKRNTIKADLVVLMRKQGTACGVAWVPNLNGSVNAGNENLGYSVVTSTPGGVYNCIEGNTLAHETGHNQGMNHDRVQHKLDYGVANPPKTQYNFGYVNKTAKFFTIMAYRSSCGNTCTRIPFFSTPLKKFNNKPVGIPQGTANAADGARLLNANRTTIGGYR